MRGVDIVIHTAALKMIETGFYSSDAVVRVNTVGTMNVAEASIQAGIKIALFISSDKSCNPMNGLIYGLSKALAESVWISYNNYSTRDGTKLCASRYGNIINSNNSFFHTIEAQKKNGKINITDPNMHRFYFKIQEAMSLNIHAIENTLGGEIFIPKLKSASVLDFIKAFGDNYPVITTGLRGVEKISEEMIAQYEMPYTYVSGKDYYKIIPSYISELGMGWDKNRPKENPIKPFLYTSDSKDIVRLSVEDLKEMVK
jgi:FlaA1/EpsC-like NDP-sugar epimerase